MGRVFGDQCVAKVIGKMIETGWRIKLKMEESKQEFVMIKCGSEMW